MLSRINFLQIIRDHLRTLRNINSSSKMVSRPDLLLFFILPLILSGILTIQKVELHSHISDFITAISILGGFLFNLLAIIYGLMDKLKLDSKDSDIKKIFVREIHTNISFNILLSLILILLLIVYSYQPNNFSCFTMVDYTFSLILYSLLILFMLTMIMVFNRIYIIMKKDNEQ